MNTDRILSDEVSTAGTDEFLDTQFEGDEAHVLKKLGLVAIATIGLSLAATPAFAAPASHHHPSAHAPKGGDCGPTCPTPDPTFGDAFWTFIDGGADLGRGAAEIV